MFWDAGHICSNFVFIWFSCALTFRTHIPSHGCLKHLVGDGGLGVEMLARRVGNLDGALLAVACQAVAGGLDVVELVRDLRLATLPADASRKGRRGHQEETVCSTARNSVSTRCGGPIAVLLSSRASCWCRQQGTPHSRGRAHPLRGTRSATDPRRFGNPN